MNTVESYRACMVGNYPEPALTLVRGEGSWVWDDNGKAYLDFTSGIAVNSLGHSHPVWVEAVRKQAGELVHTSNLFRTQPILEVATHLTRHLGGGRMLFCNSGTEANEALIKLARLHGASLSDGREGVRYGVIGAENAFHGRTFGGMSLTPQRKIQQGFAPLLPGFSFARLDDLESFERLIDATTAAIFIETIQGESGINSCPVEVLRGLRELCDRHNLLLILDEVQCGIGRSGSMFAFEKAGILPDAIGMAKGLGGGFPIGAIWIADAHASLFQPGSHGSTFAGNPLAAAATLAVLQTIDNEGLLEKVSARSKTWRASLQQLADQFPQHICELRGEGYLVGIAFSADPTPILLALRQAGLLVVPAGGQVLRLLPPLTASEAELQQSVDILRQVLQSHPG